MEHQHFMRLAKLPGVVSVTNQNVIPTIHSSTRSLSFHPPFTAS